MLVCPNCESDNIQETSTEGVYCCGNCETFFEEEK